MTLKNVGSALLMSGALVLTFGCGKDVSGGTDSTVAGTLVLDSFPTAPSAVEGLSDAGSVTTSEVTPDGGFRLPLASGHAYRLQVVLDGASEPIVFPRTSGTLDTTFAVTSRNVRVSLGHVRHFPSAPVSMLLISSTNGVGAGGAGGEGEVGECVNGVVQGSGEPCIDDDGDMHCEAGDWGGADGEHADGNPGECVNGTIMGSGAPCTNEPDVASGDGECDNGVDSVTGVACVDQGPENTVDAESPMAIAEHNAPEEVGGCGDGDGDGHDENDGARNED